MFATHATVHHGDLTVVKGVLPSNAKSALERAGALQTDDGWVCEPQAWPRVEAVLRALGVPLQAVGIPKVVVPAPTQDTRPKAAAMSLEGGRIRIQGDMPKPVQKHWMGSDRASGHLGMSPWAIEDFLATCKEQGIQVQLEPAVEALRSRLQRRREAVDAALEGRDWPDVALPGDYKLRDYQRQAIAFGEACGGRFFIADDVGAGKTAEAIGWKRFADAKRILLICPSIAKGGWKEEIKDKFDGKDSPVAILDGYADRGSRLPGRGWVITGFQTLQDRVVKGRTTNMGWMPYLRAWQPDLVIIDESHKAKAHDSDRSIAMRDLARSVRDFIPMTGTDQDKSPMDLWSTLDAIEPGWWGTWFEFGLAFCKGEEKKRWYGKGKFHKYWDMTGVSNAKVLHDRLRYVRIRRTQEQLELQLPPQTRIRVPVMLDDEARAKYATVLEEYRAFVRGEMAEQDEDRRDEDADQIDHRQEMSKGQRMKYILRLRQISSLGRIGGTVELVEDLVEQGKKPLVFAFFTQVLHALCDGLKEKGFRVGFIDGSTPAGKRDEIRHEYLAGNLDVLVGQTEAMGISMNVQEVASITVTHELTYKILDLKQTEGRAYRSGQRKPTFHYYCMGIDTRDQLTLDVLLRKLAAKRAVDEGIEENIEDDLLKEIEAEFFR